MPSIFSDVRTAKLIVLAFSGINRTRSHTVFAGQMTSATYSWQIAVDKFVYWARFPSREKVKTRFELHCPYRRNIMMIQVNPQAMWIFDVDIMMIQVNLQAMVSIIVLVMFQVILQVLSMLLKILNISIFAKILNFGDKVIPIETRKYRYSFKQKKNVKVTGYWNFLELCFSKCCGPSFSQTVRSGFRPPWSYTVFTTSFALSTFEFLSFFLSCSVFWLYTSSYSFPPARE